MKSYKGITTLEVLEGADNYNSWIASSLSSYIKSPALEIGAGIGNISEFFTNRQSLVLTDNDPLLVEQLEIKFGSKKNVKIENLDISSDLSQIKTKFRSIYAVNVLEHIKNDKKAVANCFRLLEPGGKLVLLVPAKKNAYSKLDQSLGHFRRYEKQELRNLLEGVGFSIDKLEFFNIIGLLSWMIRNKVSRKHDGLKKPYVKVFDSIVPVLRFVEPKKGLPAGISLIAIATKK